MQAIKILTEEHRLLSKVLTCLERLLQDAARSDRLDGDSALRILQFLERFADGSHQDKEEEVLFPLLLRRAPRDTRRIVQALLAEHEKERRLFAELRGNLEGAAYGEPLCLDTFVVLAQKYVAIQRKHAAWEDERLLPLAEELLDEHDDSRMLAGFRRIEALQPGGGSREAAACIEKLCEPLGMEFANRASQPQAA
jgi:hemerythrin-like domain-containing protein